MNSNKNVCFWFNIFKRHYFFYKTNNKNPYFLPALQKLRTMKLLIFCKEDKRHGWS